MVMLRSWICLFSLLDHEGVGTYTLASDKDMEIDTDIQIEAKRHVHRFRNGLPMQISLNEISKAVGNTDGLNCLDVGMSNGMMAYHLRKLGGKWHSAVADEPTAAVVKEFVSKNVDVISGQSLPFKKKHFDVVVVADFLEKVRDDNLFIEECHRILQPDGRIVITVPNSKSWTIVNPMRSILGVGPDERGWVRPGYTESQMFGILKHGFDVHQMRSYGKVMVETTDTLLRAMSARALTKADSDRSLRRIAGVGGVLLKVAYQMDMLLFLGRGFKLMATAKRRTWRPRNAPVLVDGRSISEAVLSRPGV